MRRMTTKAPEQSRDSEESTAPLLCRWRPPRYVWHTGRTPTRLPSLLLSVTNFAQHYEYDQANHVTSSSITVTACHFLKQKTDSSVTNTHASAVFAEARVNVLAVGWRYVRQNQNSRAVVVVGTYHKVRKCKDHCVIIRVSKISLHFRNINSVPSRQDPGRGAVRVFEKMAWCAQVEANIYTHFTSDQKIGRGQSGGKPLASQAHAGNGSL